MRKVCKFLMDITERLRHLSSQMNVGDFAQSDMFSMDDMLIIPEHNLPSLDSVAWLDEHYRLVKEASIMELLHFESVETLAFDILRDVFAIFQGMKTFTLFYSYSNVLALEIAKSFCQLPSSSANDLLQYIKVKLHEKDANMTEKELTDGYHLILTSLISCATLSIMSTYKPLFIDASIRHGDDIDTALFAFDRFLNIPQFYTAFQASTPPSTERRKNSKPDIVGSLCPYPLLCRLITNASTPAFLHNAIFIFLCFAQMSMIGDQSVGLPQFVNFVLDHSKTNRFEWLTKLDAVTSSATGTTGLHICKKYNSCAYAAEIVSRNQCPVLVAKCMNLRQTPANVRDILLNMRRFLGVTRDGIAIGRDAFLTIYNYISKTGTFYERLFLAHAPPSMFNIQLTELVMLASKGWSPRERMFFSTVLDIICDTCSEMRKRLVLATLSRHDRIFRKFILQHMLVWYSDISNTIATQLTDFTQEFVSRVFVLLTHWLIELTIIPYITLLQRCSLLDQSEYVYYAFLLFVLQSMSFGLFLQCIGVAPSGNCFYASFSHWDVQDKALSAYKMNIQAYYYIMFARKTVLFGQFLYYLRKASGTQRCDEICRLQIIARYKLVSIFHDTLSRYTSLLAPIEERPESEVENEFYRYIKYKPFSAGSSSSTYAEVCTDTVENLIEGGDAPFRGLLNVYNAATTHTVRQATTFLKEYSSNAAVKTFSILYPQKIFLQDFHAKCMEELACADESYRKFLLQPYNSAGEAPLAERSCLYGSYPLLK